MDTYLVCASVLLIVPPATKIESWQSVPQVLATTVSVIGLFSTGSIIDDGNSTMLIFCLLGSLSLAASLHVAKFIANLPNNGFKSENHHILVTLFYFSGMVVAILPLGMFPQIGHAVVINPEYKNNRFPVFLFSAISGLLCFMGIIGYLKVQHQYNIKAKGSK